MATSTNPAIVIAAGPVEIQAAAGEQRVRRFNVVAYTGVPLKVPGYHLPVVVDLAGLSQRRTISANLDHDSSKRVGHFDQVDNDGRTLAMSGVVSAVGAAADEFVGAADNGYPWAASIEAQPGKLDELRAGESADVNGQRFQGPAFIARNSVLSGVAFVPQAADDATSVTLAASLRGATMDENQKFEAWVSEVGFDPATVTAEQRAGLWANYNGQNFQPPKIAAASGDPLIDAEQQRVARIEAACEGNWYGQADRVAELKARAIDGDMSYDELRAELVDALRASRPQSHTVFPPRPRGGASDGAVLEAAFLSHLGHESLAERTLGADAAQMGRDLRCHSMLDIARQALQSQHVEPPRGRDQVIHAAFTTTPLPGLLGNAANKMLLDAYEEFPSVARIIAERLTATNFKTHTGYRFTADSVFEEVGEGGEIKHGTLKEAAYPFKVVTFARIFGLPFQAVVNDDLGAFATMPRQIGRGGAQKLESEFWALVLGNVNAFFAAGNGNYFDGAGSALAGASLAQAVELMLKMTDDVGEPISAIPRWLVVPPELKAVGDDLFVSKTLNVGGGSSTADDRLPGENSFFGRYEPLATPYLSNTNYTGFSSTAWYLFADSIRAFGLAFLNGQERPTVEQVPAPPEYLGTYFRGTLHAGVCQIDPRGAVKSKGAA